MKKIFIIVGSILIIALIIIGVWFFKNFYNNCQIGQTGSGRYYIQGEANTRILFGSYLYDRCDILSGSTYLLYDKDGNMSSVSKKEFYGAIESKNKECNNCVKLGNTTFSN